MKFKELYLELLSEQVPPEDQDEPMVDDNGNEINPNDDEENPFGDQDADVNPEDHADMNWIANNPDNPPQRQPRNPNPPVKKITETQKAKMKWREENPAVTDFEMDEAIQFFRERKDRLRPYKPYGTIDLATNRHYINVPEITSLVERFPEMEHILSQDQLMKDIKNYTWEQIRFYMDRILANNAVIDEENIVKGAYTPEQELEKAYERWTKPQNKLIDEGGIVVYKIESRTEAIGLGSVQRLIYEKLRRPSDENVWCVARPLNGNYGSNLYMSYRTTYGRAFHFVLDKNRKESDKYYMGALQGLRGSDNYILTSRRNDGDANMSWNDVVAIYPALRGKEQMIKWFGPTRKETNDITIDKITFNRGDQYDFATLPESYQMAYIESNRYVSQVRAFLSLNSAHRKLYVDHTSKENNDFQHRFLCDDPNDPFGILEVLRTETKPDDLYKYLDNKILKTNLGIPDGILAIKKSIIGTNWRRWLSDIDSGYTLISSRERKNRFNKARKYGLIDANNGNLIKDPSYIEATPRTYMHIYEEDGLKKRKIYIFQRYSYGLGSGQLDPNEFFYFLYLKEAMTDKNSEFYLKGKYYDKVSGDSFINDMVQTGEFKKI